ncbi:two-component system sensor histidine kinase NtrB [Pseudoxanthomonas beigongshangi]
MLRLIQPKTLEDESRQLSLLIKSVTDYAIYMLDPDGYICSWNPGGERIKGYTAQEIIGEHFSRFYTPEDAVAGVPRNNLATAAEKGGLSAEGWRVRKDGSRFLASIVIEPIWENGNLIGFAKVTRDVTERHSSQKRLEEARDALLQAQKMEAIGKLTLGLAHDFNNLLTVILNSLDVIAARTTGSDNIASPLKAAIRACDRGALLTRQLLTFGRGQDLLPQSTDLSELIRKSGDLFERACAEQVSLRFELADDLPRVLVDRAQLEAAILNLVSNSRDALEGTGNIVVRTFASPMKNPLQADTSECLHVCAEVADDGPGIPPELQAKVFDPFFTTKEVGKGSGLGLSQVFGLATQSSGFVQLVSNPGQGAVLRIWLPAHREEESGERTQGALRRG